MKSYSFNYGRRNRKVERRVERTREDLKRFKKEFKIVRDELNETKSELRKLKGQINNFPPAAINALSITQIKEIIEKNDAKEMIRILHEALYGIEQNDLIVHFAFIPSSIYPNFCKFMKENSNILDDDNNYLWTVKCVPVEEDLNAIVFMSNLKCE